MPDVSGELTFRFKYAQGGQASGFFKKQGTATPDVLILDKCRLPFDIIADAAVRDNHLVLAFDPEARLPDAVIKRLAEDGGLILAVYQATAFELKRFIDRMCSKTEVERHHQALMAAGKGELFRVQLCPECGAALDLSELEVTPHSYCRFCDAVLDENLAVVTSGSKYRLCDECGMFDRVKGYTEFYFYFLVYLIGYSYRRRHVCSNCANSIFWKMLLCNTLFLIGIPATIALKLKAMTGNDAEMQALARANAWARKGRYGEAQPLFEELRRNYPGHPGLLMNEGLGHLRGGNAEGAARCFEQALVSCANYHPVMNLTVQLAALSPAEEVEG